MGGCKAYKSSDIVNVISNGTGVMLISIPVDIIFINERTIVVAPVVCDNTTVLAK